MRSSSIISLPAMFTIRRSIIAALCICIISLATAAQESTQFRATLHLKDGTTVTGTIIRMTNTEIAIMADSSTSPRFIERRLISSIEFLDNGPTKSSPAQAGGQPSNTMRCGTVPVPAPEARGFRLGMSWDEYKQIKLGGTNYYDEADETGLRTENLNSVSARDIFKGLERATLVFLDDRLVKIEIHYDYSTTWPNSLEFTAAIAEALKLPRTGWRGNNPTTLACDDFTVQTFVDVLNVGRLVIVKPGYADVVAARQRQNEEKKRQTFKP